MGFPLEFIPAKAGAGMTGWEILGIKSFTFYPIFATFNHPYGQERRDQFHANRQTNY